MSISKKEFDVKLKRIVKEHGGATEAAKFFGISPSFLRNIVACRDIPSERVCSKMGLKAVKEIKYRYEVIK